jgi:hypothetical protein
MKKALVLLALLAADVYVVSWFWAGRHFPKSQHHDDQTTVSSGAA